ncbi:MAG: AAA family ATPase, partial [bacterium]|nr:AAA family ATPase [bacterium]
MNSVKQIPYGIADYAVIRNENYYYVDKTHYLPKIEKAGKYLFFIRPRRIGKSLFMAVMEGYYDIQYKDRFDDYFKGTWIHENPTPERGEYLVFKLNFSAVNPAPGKIEDSFLNYTRNMARSFLTSYAHFFKENKKSLEKRVLLQTTASDILGNIIALCNDSNCKIYIIVDEYDNFSNTILATSGKKAYEDLTHGEGFFRAFFNVLKAGTSNINAPISRLFISGVSPVTMDDVTSGFNTGKNISIEPEFNCMLGFTEDDVTAMIEYYGKQGMIKHDAAYLLDIMTEWYGHYLFTEDIEHCVTMFNSDMVLYFMDYYLRRNKPPKDLIDRNVRIDYGKLRHLIVLDKSHYKTTNGNFERLKQIVRDGEIAST